MALGVVLIQKEYGFSNEEIVMQIQENPSFDEILLFINGYSSLIHIFI